MTMAKDRFAFLLPLVTFACSGGTAATAQSADSGIPTDGQAAVDAKTAGNTPPEVAVVSAEAGALVWEAPVVGDVYANPTVDPDGTTVYIGSHENGGVLYKIDGTSGKVLSQVQASGAIEHSPALDEKGALYITTLSSKLASGKNGAGRTTAAYRASDLSQIWETKMDYGSDNSPVLGTNDRVYVGVVANPKNQSIVDGCHDNNKCGRYYSFDRNTGDIKIDMWLEGWEATPAAIDGKNRLFLGVEDITGSQISDALWPGVYWAIDGADPSDGSKAARSLWSGNRFKTQGDFGSPNQYVDGVAYSTCRDGYLYGFNADNGTVVLKRKLHWASWTGIAISRASNGHLVLYTGDQSGYFYAVEIDGSPEGKLLWEQKTTGSGLAFGTPAIDDVGNIYYTTSKPTLEVRSSSGSLLWSYNLPGASLGGVGGPTLLDNGLVVVGTNDSKIIAFRAFGSHLNDTAPWPKYKHDLRNTSNVTSQTRGR